MTKARTARYLWHDKGQIFIPDWPFSWQRTDTYPAFVMCDMTKARDLSDLCYVWHDKGQIMQYIYLAFVMSSLCHISLSSFITIWANISLLKSPVVEPVMGMRHDKGQIMQYIYLAFVMSSLCHISLSSFITIWANISLLKSPVVEPVMGMRHDKGQTHIIYNVW
jgi:hypothetical protein